MPTFGSGVEGRGAAAVRTGPSRDWNLGRTKRGRRPCDQARGEDHDGRSRRSGSASPLQAQLAVGGMPGSMTCRVIEVREVSGRCKQQRHYRDNRKQPTRHNARTNHAQAGPAHSARGARLMVRFSLSPILLTGLPDAA